VGSTTPAAVSRSTPDFTAARQSAASTRSLMTLLLRRQSTMSKAAARSFDQFDTIELLIHDRIEGDVN
jgi:hypothetical protein